MLSVRSVLRGALRRFLPASALTVLGVLLLFDGRGVLYIRPAGWLGMAGLLVAVTAGFVAALVAGRWRLRSDSGVDGRRSAVAAPLALILLAAASTVTQGLDRPWRVALAIAAGGVAAVITFWPWLRRPLDEATLSAWEGVPIEPNAPPELVAGPATLIGSSAVQAPRSPERRDLLA